MENTNNLKLPLLVPNQSSKEITHNEALIILDNVLQNGAVDKDLSTPPEMAEINDLYILPNGCTGDWEGHDGGLAFYDNGWRFVSPREGFVIWVSDEDSLYVFNGTNWQKYIGNEIELPTIIASLEELNDVAINDKSTYDLLQYDGSKFTNTKTLQELSMVGVNTNADENNKLSVKSDYVLFDNVEENSRVKVNKANESATASHLFQDNYGGRAEFGLIGDDNFTLKVSSDGLTWNEAFKVDGTNGNVDFKQKFTVQNQEIHMFLKDTFELDNDVQIVITNLNDGLQHRIVIEQMLPSVNNTNIYTNFSSDGGQTWITSLNYTYGFFGVVNNANFLVNNISGQKNPRNQIISATDDNNNGIYNEDGARPYNGEFNIIDPYTNLWKTVIVKENYYITSGNSRYMSGIACLQTTLPCDAIKFQMSAGTFRTGRVKHYIIK